MKLLIVDDHPVVRQGLVALLAQLGPDTETLQASTANEALAALEAHADVDVVLLDLMMPGMSGMAAIGEFGRRRPEVPVIVLSSSEDPHEARSALAFGALGYVPKSASQHTLIAAIQLVLKGDLYVPPLVLGDPSGLSRGQLERRAGQNHSPLTDRQIDVLRRLSVGQPNKTIALELQLSEKTVKAHITAIFRALNVVNRTQAAAAGREYHLI
jgi:DNA-binding NarL/FixJ family response regulator